MRTLFCFSGISAICLLLHNFILISLDVVGIGYGIATMVSYIIVVFVGYGLHSGFSFRSAHSLPAFARYAVAMLANVPAQWFLFWLLIDQLALSMAVSAPLSTAALTIYNFTTSRWAVKGQSA